MNSVAIGLLAAALQALTLWVLTGIRTDIHDLMERVGKHESFIAALKMKNNMKETYHD